MVLAVAMLGSCDDGRHTTGPPDPIDAEVDGFPPGFGACDGWADVGFGAPWTCDARCPRPSVIGHADPNTPLCHSMYPDGTPELCVAPRMLADGSGCCMYTPDRGDMVVFLPCP